MAKYRKYVTGAALATVFAVSGYVGSAFAEDTGNVRVWFMQSSVSDQAIDWLETEFAAQNPGSTLSVEVQPWADIVSRLLTSLASKTESPDIVELGNTKTATFGNVGALADVTDLYDEIDGDNLIPSFVKAATINDKIYAYPLYAGTSVMFYRKDLFEKAGIESPETIEELVDATIALEAANPDGVEGFKGIYFPVIDVHGIEGWLFTYGANYAHLEDGKWKSGLDTPEAKAAFEQLQKIWANSALGALDGRETAGNAWVPYNDGEIGMFSYRAWAQSKISDELRDKTGVMALPPAKAGGQSHQFLGGSNVAISASSQQQELAKKALKLIMSETFMTHLAADSGWVPGNVTYAASIPDSLVPSDLQQKIAATSDLTPAAPNWAIVEGNNVPIDTYTGLAKGESIDDVVARAGAKIESILNSN